MPFPSALGFEDIADILAHGKQVSVVVAGCYERYPYRHAVVAFEAWNVHHWCV